MLKAWVEKMPKARKKGKITHVQKKEEKGERWDHAKRSSKKFDCNN
jgi:hypothetical protein